VRQADRGVLPTGFMFLDEPTTGLDPQARRSMWETIRAIQGSSATVFLTTHYMEEAQTLCDRVAVMDAGRVIALDLMPAWIKPVSSALPLTYLADALRQTMVGAAPSFELALDFGVLAVWLVVCAVP